MRRITGVASATMTAALALAAALLLALSPDAIPPAWNPAIPLRIADQRTPVTGWKLRRALSTEAACLAALAGEGVERMPPLDAGDGCGIDRRVVLSRIGATRLVPLQTDCRTALRLAMWERHVLRPEARRLLGSGVAEIRHLTSYACRPVRTPGGGGGRLSTHARGLSIDVTGMRLDDGRALALRDDWRGEDAEALFLRRARDGACDWFGTVLGPDYNRLHADHLHLQGPGRGLCR